VGDRDGAVPISEESLREARCQRAHAFAGANDEGGAFRAFETIVQRYGHAESELRAALLETPGPASALVPRFLEQRRAGAVAASRPVRRSAKQWVGLLFGQSLITGPLFFLFCLPMLFPSLFFKSCGMTDLEDELVADIAACPEAAAALGPNVATSAGWSCGNFEFGESTGTIDWSVAVSGDEGRGSVELHGYKSMGQWHLAFAYLDADRGTVDVVACAQMARAGVQELSPGATSAPSSPFVLPPEATQGFGAATGMLEGLCNAGQGQTCDALGTMYENGAGVPRDLVKARQSYTRACALGFTSACSKAGVSASP
jgi:hypothetical protein